LYTIVQKYNYTMIILIVVSYIVSNGMVWYGMVNVDLYSTIITKVSNVLDTLVSGEKPGFQTNR